ncbi:hypothetical protein Hanom_Chr09g00817791 [Helianthus anomalus]
MVYVYGFVGRVAHASLRMFNKPIIPVIGTKMKKKKGAVNLPTPPLIKLEKEKGLLN